MVAHFRANLGHCSHYVHNVHNVQNSPSLPFIRFRYFTDLSSLEEYVRREILAEVGYGSDGSRLVDCDDADYIVCLSAAGRERRSSV